MPATETLTTEKLTPTIGAEVLNVWDNTGTVHRAMPYDPASGREMHRTTWLGDEPIQ